MATISLVSLLLFISNSGATPQFTIDELARSYSIGNSSLMPIGNPEDLFVVSGWKNSKSKLKAHKKIVTEGSIEEIECLESMYMGPFHDPVTITRNSSFLAGRQDPTCTWLFFGTAPCVPTVTCPTFDLNLPSPTSGLCDSEYLELFDGYSGVERYCGKTGPIRVTPADNLRDLFIKFHTVTTNTNSHNFSCTVTCSEKGANPLPKKYVEKVDPKCRCGTKSKDERIVGGVVADKHQFPWLVALVQTNTRQPFCGGSILNNRIILTAAHCFKGQYQDINNLEVLVNAHLLDSTPNTLVLPGHPEPKTYDAETLERLDSGNNSYRFKLEEAYIHPLYVAETNDFDVASILLSKPIDFTKTNKPTPPGPICLPEPGSYGRTFANKRATVAGWGLPGMNATGTPEVVQKVDVHVFIAPDCKKFYSYRVNHRMMCAGFRDGGTDSCSGDSGGPLILEDRKNMWYEIGSVSWGDGCAQEGMPGVYFRTTETSQWLHYYSNMNNAAWCSLPE